jgi:CRP-like cAMP-binding protein
MLSIVEKVIFLQNVDVFAEIPSEQLSYMAAIAEELSFSAGDKVYEADQPSDALYVVLDGKVRLHRGDEEITVAQSSEPFGTWALFDDTPRVATATAAEDTRVLCIDRDDFLDLLSDHVQITQGVLKSLVGRLRGLLDRVGTDIGPRGGS